ncbi:MAG TPA: tetratricopeptide repeat protein [Mucilaginibacter sp.]|jgi:tetratricopeptide (TPR) repeat protein|nr:tetratricopeptide repeat protein [Mucilaginibacter sp.]
MKIAFTFLLFLGTIVLFSNFHQPQEKTINEQLVEFYQNQRFADAVALLKSNYPEPIADTKVLASMAYASQMSGKLADAEKYYSRIYELDSSNYHVLFNLGNVNLLRGNELKAKGYFTDLLKKDSSSFAAYKDMAAISTDQNNSSLTMYYLEKANTLQPTDADVASELSGFYTDAKKYNLAENVINKALEADRQNLYLLQSLVKLQYAEHKFNDVITNGELLLTLGDQSAYILNKLGEAYFSIKDYDCSIETFSAIPATYQTEGTFYYMAECYKMLNNQPKAIEYFNRAIEAGLSANIDSYYSEIADSYTDLKKDKKAIGAYQKSLQFSEKPITYYLMANLYDSDLKNCKMAVVYYKKFIAAKPAANQQKYVVYAKSRIEALKH